MVCNHLNVFIVLFYFNALFRQKFLPDLHYSLTSYYTATELLNFLLVVIYSCANTCNNMPTTKPAYKVSIHFSGFYIATHHYYRIRKSQMDSFSALYSRWMTLVSRQVLTIQTVEFNYSWLIEHRIENLPLTT